MDYSKTQNNNYQDLCRACLQVSDNMKSFLLSTGETSNILDMYTSLNNFQLEINTNGPSKICRACEDKLTIGFNFKIQCVESEKRINNYYSSPDVIKFECQVPDTNDDDECTSEIESDSNNEGTQTGSTEKFRESSALPRKPLEKFPKDQVREVIEEIQARNSRLLNELRQCILCPEVPPYITSCRGLRSHMCRLHKDVHNWCSVCNKLIDNNDFKSHKSRHLKEEEDCKFCHKPVQKTKMLLHLELHSDEDKSCFCEICNKKFANTKYLEQHLFRHAYDDFEILQQSHKNGRIIKLEIDDEKLNGNFENIEMKSNSKEDTTMETSFESESVHREEEEQDSDSFYMARVKNIKTEEENVVSLRCKDNNLIQKATRIVGDITRKQRECLFCNFTAENSQDLTSHVKDQHRDIKNWCSQCNELVLKNFGQHNTNHVNEQIECPFCLSKHSKSNYVEHLRKHISDKNFEKADTLKDTSTETCHNQENVNSETSNVVKRIEKIKLLYGCSMCEKKFMEVETVKHHLHQSHGVEDAQKYIVQSKERGYTCNICGKKFTRGTTARNHMKKQHKSKKIIPDKEIERVDEEENKYVCNICGKKFTRITAAKIHMIQNHKSQIGSPVNKLEISEIEKFSKEEEEEMIICNICEQKFGDSSTFEAHMVQHSSEKDDQETLMKDEEMFGCDVCKKLFSCKDMVTQHLQQCHTVAESDRLIINVTRPNKRYSCKICEKKFTRKSYVKSHMARRHMPIKGNRKTSRKPIKGVRIHECDICHRSFTRYTYMQKHRLQHTKKECIVTKESCEKENGENEDIQNEIYECHTCGKDFTNKDLLILHLNLHSGNGEHKCSYCGRVCKDRAKLIEHERVHTGERPFICNVCGKGFKQRGTLGTHMKIHNEKKELCHLCDDKFSTAFQLRLHMLKHTGEKPFLCSECGKSYNTKTTLNSHMRVHTGETPYKCDQCERAFRTISVFKRHLMVHTGHRPIKCQHCSFATTTNYNLKVHMKRHSIPTTEGQQHVCQVCGYALSTKLALQLHMTSIHYTIL